MQHCNMADSRPRLCVVPVATGTQRLRVRPGSVGPDGAATSLPQPDMALPGSKGQSSPRPRAGSGRPWCGSPGNCSQRKQPVLLAPGIPTHLPVWPPNPGASLGAARQHLWASTCTAQRASEPGLTCPPSGHSGRRDQQGDGRFQEWRARDREKAVGQMRRAGQVGELGKDGGSSWGQRVHLEKEEGCWGRARRMDHWSWGRGSITSMSPWPGAGSMDPASPNGHSLGERELLGSGRGCREMERDPFGQTPASFFLAKGSQTDCHFVTSVCACGHL